MSASTARATRRPAGRPARASARGDQSWAVEGSTARVRRPRPRALGQTVTAPALHVVRSAVPQRSTVPFILLITVILTGALLASMALNAQMARTAFRMQTAQVELNTVNDHIDTVRSQVEQASSSDRLAQRAADLGMVPAGSPGVVDLDTATVSGGAAGERPGAEE